MATVLARIKRTYSAEQFFAAVAVAIIVAGVAGYLIGRSSAGVRESLSPVGGVDNNSAVQHMQENSLGTGSAISGSTISGDYLVLVRDQAAGNSVIVATARFAESGGWVVIHEDRDGKPGNILGAQFYQKGETKDGAVGLLRPTVKGVYYAMLHRDDGDRQFDFTTDSPVTNSDGQPVMARFTVSEAQ